MTVIATVVGLVTALVVVGDSLSNWQFGESGNWAESVDARRGLLTVSLIWIFSAIALTVSSDFVGRVFSPLLPVPEWVPQDASPRLIPFSTGLFERTLFTGLSILLLKPNTDREGALLFAIGAYIALRAIRINRGDTGERRESQRATSVHAIWNISVSLALATASGWLFWRVPFT